MSKFWTIFVPAVIGGLGFYAYTAPNFMGNWVRGILSPVVEPMVKFFARLF